MRGLQLAKPGERFSVLCLGAHSDDIEIGAGGTLLSLMERGVQLNAQPLAHGCVQLLPCAWHDGFFYALLEKATDHIMEQRMESLTS